MPRNSLRFPTGLRYWFWGAFGSLFITGVIWLVIHYSSHSEEDLDSTARVLESWMLRLHGFAAYLALLVLGAVYVRHLRPAWRSKRNLGSGSVLTCSLVLLILSGYGLYYFAGESFRNWTAYVHDCIGVALPLLIVVHIWRGRSQRPKINSSQQ